ncbi:MAG: inositol monophosphatase family protein [Thermoanaerobaculia bacterium]
MKFATPRGNTPCHNSPAVSHELLEVAVAAARAGGTVLGDFFRKRPLEPELKTENDFVTLADRAAETAVLAEIRRHYPDHRILAEEGGWTGGNGSDYSWIVDPLDGTTNFLRGLPVYGVSVACSRGEEVMAGAVYDPEGGNLFKATRGGGAYWNDKRMEVSKLPDLRGAFVATGYPFKAREAVDLYLDTFRSVFARAQAIRRCGAAALDLAYTAAGVYDGFFEFRLSPWDIAAGALLIEEAGGLVSDLDGGDGYMEGGNVIAGAPFVQQDLLEVVGRHVSEKQLDELVPRPGVPTTSAC